MNLLQWCASGMLAVLLLAGCDKPKSPEAAAKDVAATEEVAAREQARAEQKAVNQVENAAAKVDDKTVALDDAAAKAARDVLVAKADGDHKIALEKCEALSGDALRNCKAQADADYAAAKTDAKAVGNP